MKGRYNFYEDGRLVHTAENLITDAGKRSILRALAGQQPQFARAIAVGAGDTAPTPADTRLTAEFDRANVSVSSPNYNTNSITYKCTLSGLATGRIYEVGLFELTTSSNANSTILSFDKDLEPWTAGDADTEYNRIGPASLLVAAATNGSTTTTLSDFVVDLDVYAFNDVFTLTFFTTDANTSSLTIRFRAADTANYFQISPTVTQGYNVVNFTKDEATKTGSLTWADVRSVEVRVNAKATDTALDPEIYPTGLGYTGTRVYLDSLSVVGRYQHDTENTLISHSVLGGFVQKTAGRPVDVEYVLDLDL